ncbi:carbohydrate sulfotransferase 4-like isoform X2 [Montipora capricornis]
MVRKRKLKYLFALLLTLAFVSLGFLISYTERSHPNCVKIAQNTFHASRDVLSDVSETAQPLKSSSGRNRSQYNLTNASLHSTSKRLVLLIVAHGRSGSTFLADIFNQHPRVFYIFEPLHVLNARLLKPGVYDIHAFDLLHRIFQCDFSNVTQHSGVFYRFKSRAMSSPPFCKYNPGDPSWDFKHCSPVKREDLEYSCKMQHDTIVYKLLLERIPGQSIANIFQVCEKAGLACNVIHLIRDIRPVMISSKMVSFFKEVNQKSKPSLRQYVYSRCEMTEKNLHIVKTLQPTFRKRYAIVRYEDLAKQPLTLLQYLYDFAGLEVLDSIKLWLRNVTHPSETKLKEQANNPVSVVRDSVKTLNKWRIVADSCEVNVIERYCRDVMEFLGYVQTRGSDALLRNLTTPLFRDTYPLQEWNTG